MSIEGGCLCGSVRYRIAAEPITMRVCWCRVCQYLAAGNGAANLVFPSDAVSITGELSTYTCVADSGNVIQRRFCPTCGTPVSAHAQARPHVMVLRAGTLDDPSVMQPLVNIWTDSAPAWVCMNESLPSFPQQPPPM